MAGPHGRAVDGPAIGRTTTATMLLVVAVGRGAFSSGPLSCGAEAGDGRGGGANGVTVNSTIGRHMPVTYSVSIHRV